MPEYDSLADLYDLEYGHGHDLPFWLALADRECGQGGRPLVEWGAGTGRLSLPLADAGFDVTAVEVSEEMLKRGREKGTVEWVRGDMRDVELGRSYGLAISAFNSFLCLLSSEDALAFLLNAREHLDPGGLLAIEVSAFAPEDLCEPLGGSALRHDFDRETPRGYLVRTSVSRYDPASQLLRMRLFYEVYDQGGTLVEKRAHGLTVRVVGRAELELMLRLAGFELEAVYGGFGGEPFDGESERMITLARPL